MRLIKLNSLHERVQPPRVPSRTKMTMPEPEAEPLLEQQLLSQADDSSDADSFYNFIQFEEDYCDRLYEETVSETAYRAITTKRTPSTINNKPYENYDWCVQTLRKGIHATKLSFTKAEKTTEVTIRLEGNGIRIIDRTILVENWFNRLMTTNKFIKFA